MTSRTYQRLALLGWRGHIASNQYHEVRAKYENNE